ncbi:hypothetical protein [Botrimarina mediterranea]|uniref:hypothetical protein n=1 Tax=Botrimarina mediterranea TaxID=2528022 RepID=UPI0018D4B1D3|nr:hypothetical protein [Botrimarina mediterranea]
MIADTPGGSANAAGMTVSVRAASKVAGVIIEIAKAVDPSVAPVAEAVAVIAPLVGKNPSSPLSNE